jgi:two-component sensor histidine kinase
MVATTALEIGVKRRAVPIWLLDRKTAGQFASLVFLAVASLAVSAVVMNRAWDARDWVRQTSQAQLQIDRIVWHLMKLEQATWTQTLNTALKTAPEPSQRFVSIRGDVGDDLSELARLTTDDSYQQQRTAELGSGFGRYFANLDRIFAQDAGGDINRSLVLATAADVARLSQLVTEMRDHEDGLLKRRTRRADILLTALFPTLSFAAAVIAFLVVFAARWIGRTLRERETVLSRMDSELAAKDLMMREIDHRVRNSLNLVYNLMTFQQRRTIDPGARSLLTEAANQVLVVARVHERLYKYGSMEAVELGDYLRGLCSDVAAFSLPAEAQAAIQLHTARAELRAEEAIWLGLIVVELVTNALKYGSPSLQSPIVVDVSPDEKELRVVVSDGGAGLPLGFDLRTSKGLGMQVVVLLVRQLHATLEVDPAWAGTRFILTVPLSAVGPTKRGELAQPKAA